MEKYVLTGAPGSGKSSIILGLEQLGEGIIFESAKSYIEFKQAQGIKEPWNEDDFQESIINLQLSREQKIHPNYKRVFLDRCIIDGLAYLGDKHSLVQTIIDESKKANYNKNVFLIEQLASIETNEFRRENYTEAKERELRLEQKYIEQGFNIIRISPDNLENRIQEILKYCK